MTVAPHIRKSGRKARLITDKTALAKLAEEINKSGHSVFSPSGSAMWLHCAGSLIANMMEEDRTSPEAAEGTVAHFVAETWLRSGRKPKELLDTVQVVEERGLRFEILVTNVMMDYVQEYVDWCMFEPGEHYTETRVFFSELTPLPNQSGTADHAACQPGKLVITDLKYGKGILVFAEGNTQARIYALGFFMKYDHLYHFEEIEMRIAQPRLNHFDSWTISRAELLEFADYLKERANAAWQVNAPRCPSEKACQWCKVKADCVALARLQHALIEGNFRDIGREYAGEELEVFADWIGRGKYKVRPADVTRFTTEQLAKLRPYRRLVESWWRTMDENLERRALDGEKVPGMKLVESRTNREYVDEAKAADLLILYGLEEDQIYTRKILSPTQAEEVLRNELKLPKKVAHEVLERYVRKPAGKPTLVPLSDKRPELEAYEETLWDDEGMFDDEDDEL